MTFNPVLPTGGIAGWRFLKRTMETQQAQFSSSALVSRDTDYFREKITAVKSADDLIRNPRLLKVALGAFGLSDDVNKQAFVRKVLEEGTGNPNAFANRLVDKRYASLSKAFGFGDIGGPRTNWVGFADKIIRAYETQAFETAVGEQNDQFRIALNFRREIGELLGGAASETTGWLRVLGRPPLRKMMETAFALPPEFNQLDLDNQVRTLKEKAAETLGVHDFAALADPEKSEALINRFLVRSEATIQQQASTATSPALALLQAIPRPFSPLETLFALRR